MLRQKHRGTPKGHSKIKADFMSVDMKTGSPKRIKGYQGEPGFEYHPTKGFRKSNGFIPSYK